VAKKNWQASKQEDEEMLRMLSALSPEGLREVQKEMTAIFVKILSKSKTAEEMIEIRDKMLAPTPLPQPPIIVEGLADLKKQFHEALLEKKRSPFKAIKGRKPQKKIRQTLKGKFDL
jgi:hypothetical protein